MDPKLADAVIFINETDIAWSTDIDTKFKEQTTEPLRQWLNVTNGAVLLLFIILSQNILLCGQGIPDLAILESFGAELIYLPQISSCMLKIILSKS